MSDVVIVNCSTGEVEVRPMTDAEIAQQEADRAEMSALIAAQTDPIADLLTAVDEATSIRGIKDALRAHLPRAFGRQ